MQGEYHVKNEVMLPQTKELLEARRKVWKNPSLGSLEEA